jgi:hypothetical protein
VRPNIGGSGAAVTRFNTPEDLALAAERGELIFALDSTALVQEFIPAQDAHIVRVEVLNGTFLYAIKVHITGESFDLCPADICRTPTGAELSANQASFVLDAAKKGLALAAVTERLEIMVAVRPTFHHPALLAKQAANLDRIANGRLTLNVVSSWWADGATKYGIACDRHDDRYARTSEWLDVVDGCWKQQHFSYERRYYRVADNVLSPKPVSKPRPTLYAGGESQTAKDLIAAKCDAYLMHGDPPENIAKKIADMRERANGPGCRRWSSASPPTRSCATPRPRHGARSRASPMCANPRAATRTTGSGSPDRSSTRRSRSKTTPFPIADCARDSSAQRNN